MLRLTVAAMPGAAARSRRCPSPPSCGDAPQPQRGHEPPLSSAAHRPMTLPQHPERGAMAPGRRNAGTGPGMPGVPARPPGPVTAVPPPRTATRSVPCSLPPGSPATRAWAFLLKLNGLRVSDTTGADIAQLGLEREPPGSSIVTGSSVNAMIYPAPARPRRKTPSDAGHICSAADRAIQARGRGGTGDLGPCRPRTNACGIASRQR
jgi:hypothetical protein